MDDQGQEQPASLAECTTLCNQAITDLNTLISLNGSDLTGQSSLNQVQVVANDLNQIRNILSSFINVQVTGA